MELQQFIDSNKEYSNLFKKEGLKVVKYKNLIIVKNYYDKPLTFNDETDYWKMYCRGAIIDTIKNIVICVPPVKSILTDMDKGITFVGGEIQCLVDGTMINFFYTNGEWLLATRSEIGGHNKWINKKSFKKMFEECCDIDMNLLDKDCSYSFVMRHKENRNVSPIKENEVYLVEVYKFNYHLPSKGIERLTLDQYPSSIQKISTESASNMESMINNFEIKGYTVKEDNKRYKIVNPEFERVKSLKINMNNELLNYIELRKNGNLKEYLKYYPEHSKLFEEYRSQIHNLSNSLYNNYKDCFIFKKKEKKELPYHLKPFVNEIHKKYLENKKPTTWQDIKDYIHNLPSKRLVFALNYSN